MSWVPIPGACIQLRTIIKLNFRFFSVGHINYKSLFEVFFSFQQILSFQFFLSDKVIHIFCVFFDHLLLLLIFSIYWVFWWLLNFFSNYYFLILNVYMEKKTQLTFFSYLFFLFLFIFPYLSPFLFLSLWFSFSFYTNFLSFRFHIN